MQRIASLLNKLVDLQWRGLAVWIIWSLEVTRNEPVLFSLFFKLTLQIQRDLRKTVCWVMMMSFAINRKSSGSGGFYNVYQ